MQEKNAEYLQQVNQLLKKKFGDQKIYDRLQMEHSALQAQVAEPWEEHN